MTKDTPYPGIEIDSWSAFVDRVSEHPFKTWAFRGQQSSNWELSSSLYRYLSAYLPDRGEWVRRERHILRAFMRRAHLLLERIPGENEVFEWWGLMQHHGAPTRLIDFTWSPYVAAFFALEKATDTASVWALNPNEMENITSAEDLPIQEIEGTTLLYGEPFILSRRLVAQQGTFVVAKALNKPIDEIISRQKNRENILVKFLLPVDKVRSEGMKALYRMNITQATLFPGLDGLARSMGYELEFRWYE